MKACQQKLNYDAFINVQGMSNYEYALNQNAIDGMSSNTINLPGGTRKSEAQRPMPYPHMDMENNSGRAGAEDEGGYTRGELEGAGESALVDKNRDLPEASRRASFSA